MNESLEVRRQKAKERKDFLRIAREDQFDQIRPAMVEEAEAYLADLGVTLWADWDITDPARRRLAAEWLVEEVLNVNRYTADHCTCEECVPT